jgi:hypothetical protein
VALISRVSLLLVLLVTLGRSRYETGGIKMSKEKKELFVGIDLHKRRWHVTVRDADVELFSGNIPSRLESL